MTLLSSSTRGDNSVAVFCCGVHPDKLLCGLMAALRPRYDQAIYPLDDFRNPFSYKEAVRDRCPEIVLAFCELLRIIKAANETE
jgi:hypothetical protein